MGNRKNAGDLIDINGGFSTLLKVSQMPEPPGQLPGDLNPWAWR